MTYEEFRKQYPAIRCYHRFSPETRVNLATSRTGYKRRQATGEYYYTHPQVPGLAFPTAKAATTEAYRRYQKEYSSAADQPTTA